MTLPLFNFQQYASNIMAGRDRYGLHDEMGIGKTATSIGAINAILGERGVIVCPAMLRENWIKEFKKFSAYPLRLCKGRTIHDFLAWSRGRFDVLITSYEQATKWMPDFHRIGEYIDFAVFDEAHYLKNADAGRTTALLGQDANGERSLIQYAAHSWHVTGTPMSNDPMDIYTFLRFAQAVDLAPAEFVKIFFDRQLGTYAARHTVKPHMVKVLQQLIDNNSIRRNHADVGMELPPIWLTETLIEGSTIDIEEAIKGYPHLEEAIIVAIETGDISYLDAAHIAMVRRLVGKAKAVPYAQMLKAELDAGAKKRVAFFCHTEPLLYVDQYLTKFGYKVARAYGDTRERDRQQALTDFIEGDADVFLLNMIVGGTGLTIIVGSDVDVVESSWTPATNAQALKRVHRYGQLNAVHARFITLAKSIDENVNRIVAEKTAAIAEIERYSMAAIPLDATRSAP